MEITCWNCKTVATLDKAAIAQMDASNKNFYDVPCVDVYETWTDGKNTWARIGEDTWAAVEYGGDKLMEIIKS